MKNTALKAALAAMGVRYCEENLSEIVDILDENLEFKTIKNKDLDFSYRHSKFMEKDWIVLKAYFKLKKGNKEELCGKEYRTL